MFPLRMCFTKSSRIWRLAMPDEKKPRHPETNFLPPLNMILSFFNKDARKRVLKKKEVDEQKEADEKTVEKLIEKLSEKEE
jgi:hypothetical protein